MLKNILNSFISSSLTRKHMYAGLGVLIVIAFAVLFFKKDAPLEITKQDANRTVTIMDVASLSSEATPLPLVGEVRSQNEAILRTESAGTVTAVYRKAGDYVSAGTVIAELENSAQRASVAQARALVSQAEASLAKVKKGARDEQLAVLGISAGSAETTLRTARQQGVNTVLASYATAEDVVLRTTDKLLSNPTSASPSFILATSDAQLSTNIVNARLKIENILEDASTIKSGLSANSNILLAINSAEADLTFTKSYLDSVASALSKAIPSDTLTSTTIGGYQAEVATARSLIIGQLSALTTAKQSIEGAEAGLSISLQNQTEGVSGARSEDIAVAEAGVEQVQAGLRASLAQLENTIIRTPISGRIASLSISKGEFASQFSPAAIVSNQNALEIISYISEGERENIVVGAKALIAEEIRGVVTGIAPGLDPATKKIRLSIGVTDEGAPLTHGASVSLTVERSRPVVSESVTDIIIPISALKLSIDKAVVFSVNAENILEEHVVTMGRVLGNKVNIESGLTPSMIIVVDARGLKAGQAVTIQ